MREISHVRPEGSPGCFFLPDISLRVGQAPSLDTLHFGRLSNAKTYVVQRDLADGRTRRVTVGAVNELSLEKARARAADTLDDLRRGIDQPRGDADAEVLSGKVSDSPEEMAPLEKLARD